MIYIPWWMKDKKMYEQVVKDLKDYPGLQYGIKNNQFIVSGAWPVYGGEKGNEEYIEDVSIGLIFPDNYPEKLPHVYEIGRKIKEKNECLHFWPDDSACLFYPAERYFLFPSDKPFRIKDFLEGPVKQFFFSQIYYIHYKEWPFKARSHNEKGVIEFYSEKLKIPCEKKCVLDALEYLLKPQIKGHWPCPCGTNKLIRYCHIEQFQFLQNKIPIKEIMLGVVRMNDPRSFSILINSSNFFSKNQKKKMKILLEMINLQREQYKMTKNLDDLNKLKFLENYVVSLFLYQVKRIFLINKVYKSNFKEANLSNHTTQFFCKN